MGAAAHNESLGWPGRIEHWFLGPAPVHVMVLNRCILGGVLFLHAISRIPEFGVLYGSASSAWSTAHREFVSSFLIGNSVGDLAHAVVSVLAQLGPETREILLVTLYGVLVAASLAFALGFFTRTAGVVAVGLHVLLIAIHPFADWSWQRMVVPFTAYVILSRAGDYASVDAWRRRRRAAGPAPNGMAPVWPMRLLQIHVVTMYFTSFARIDDPEWLGGRALYLALARTLYTKFNLDLDLLAPALMLLCYAVFVLEPVAVVLLWIPRIRTLCALALLAMHVTLEILTNVGWWNYLMIGGLLPFLPTPWVARFLPTIPRGRVPT